MAAASRRTAIFLGALLVGVGMMPCAVDAAPVPVPRGKPAGRARARARIKPTNPLKLKAASCGLPRLPRPAYVGIKERRCGFDVSILAGKRETRAFVCKPSHRAGRQTTRRSQQIIEPWLDRYAATHGLKFIAATLDGPSNTGALRSRLWLKQDTVVPVARPPRGRSASQLARIASSFFDADHNAVIRMTRNRRVEVAEPLVTLKEYRKAVSPGAYKRLVGLARRCRERKLKLVFISSTERGGGVALMRHAMLRLYQSLGVDASWYVMPPDKAVFKITKQKIHNGLQDVGDPKDKLTGADVARLRAWSRKAARVFGPELLAQKNTVFVIDDYQPSGLIPLIRQVNPDARILFRAHTELRGDRIAKQGTRANAAWSYVLSNLEAGVDGLIFHPVDKFVPADARRRWGSKIRKMQPTTDELDGLNKKLTGRQVAYYLRLLNRHLKRTGQPALDLSRPHIHQIARFDPSKGIPDVLEAYSRLRQRLIAAGIKGRALPQLVLIGHGAVDDPEGRPIYEATIKALHGRYQQMAKDVIVARIPHTDQVLNAIRSTSEAATQLSHAEGFEIEATGAQAKGNPVVVTNVGGLPGQVRGGYVVRKGDVQAVADHMFRLLTDPALHARKSGKAKRVSPGGFTWSNATNWLELATHVVDGRLPAQRLLRSP